MNIPDDKLPPLMTSRQVTAKFGILPHYAQAIVRAGLRPVAFPLTEADGYFLKEEVLAAGHDKNFLIRLRREMRMLWKQENR